MRAPPSIADIDVAGRTVLVRADLNVPVKSGKVTAEARVGRLLPRGGAPGRPALPQE